MRSSINEDIKRNLDKADIDHLEDCFSYLKNCLFELSVEVEDLNEYEITVKDITKTLSDFTKRMYANIEAIEQKLVDLSDQVPSINLSYQELATLYKEQEAEQEFREENNILKQLYDQYETHLKILKGAKK